MTVFGKLLVFLNLLFSVITGALIVVVFTTRANWKAAFDDAKIKAERAESAYLAEKAAHDNDLKQKDSGSSSLIEELKAQKLAVTDAQAEADRAKRAVEEQIARTQAALNDAKRLEQEMLQIKGERTTLSAEQDALRAKVVAIQVDLDKWKSIGVFADQQAKNLQQKNQNLLRSLEELTLKVRDLETTGTLGGGAGTGIGTSIVDGTPKSAPPGVRGSITEVSTTGSGLAQVNIGSDSGLSTGNVLTVYTGSEYKGDLTLTAVNPKTAVGKFTPSKRGVELKKNDSVITSFSGVSQ